MFEAGGKLEKIGYRCFASTSLEAVALPKALKEISWSVFDDCGNLKMIYVEDGCEASLRNVCVSDSVKIGPLPETRIGNMRVWDLRKLKDVIIPNEIEKIENY